MARPDRGETLLEVLITLVLVGIGVAGVLAALLTGATGSRSTQATTDSRALLVAVAEQIQGAPYAPCAGPSSYSAAVNSAMRAVNLDGSNASTTPVTVKVDYWTTTSAGALGFSSSDCSYDNTAGSQGRLQRITLQTSPDENLTIVKRAP